MKTIKWFINLYLGIQCGKVFPFGKHDITLFCIKSKYHFGYHKLHDGRKWKIL